MSIKIIFNDLKNEYHKLAYLYAKLLKYLKMQNKTLFLLSTSLSVYLIFSCSANGPPFPNKKYNTAIDIEGTYLFNLHSKLYNKYLAGELILKKGTGKIDKTYFKIKSIGINLKQNIRQRVYEGKAYKIGPRLMELRSERCFLYGQENWGTRITPLERWDCDHLYFTYKSPSLFTQKEREVLLPIKTEHTKYSNWLSPPPLIPIPIRVKKTIKKSLFFVGSIIPTKETKKNNLIIVWGHRGGFKLRNEQILIAQNKLGRDIGRLKVISRNNDVVLCRWLGGGKYQKEAIIAYVSKRKFNILPNL